jgi:hypothetical protein
VRVRVRVCVRVCVRVRVRVRACVCVCVVKWGFYWNTDTKAVKITFCISQGKEAFMIWQ